MAAAVREEAATEAEGREEVAREAASRVEVAMAEVASEAVAKAPAALEGVGLVEASSEACWAAVKAVAATVAVGCTSSATRSTIRRTHKRRCSKTLVAWLRRAACLARGTRAQPHSTLQMPGLVT